MSRWAGPSRALVVVAAAAGLVLTAGALPHTIELRATAAVTPAEAAVVPVRQSALVCPGPETEGVAGVPAVTGGTTSVLATTAADAALGGIGTSTEPGRLTLITQSTGSAPAEASARGAALSASLAGPTLAEVRAVGSLAAGVAAVQTWLRRDSDDRGLVATACPAPGAEAWLLAGGGDPTRRERLLVANAGANPATVDVEVFGGAGRIATVGGTHVVVPPHGRVGLLVDALAPGEPTPAVHVTATGGLVVAVLEDSWIEGAVGRGRDDVGPAAGPSTEAVIPVALSGHSRLRVLVPGADEAVVQTRVLTSGAAQALPADGVVRVPGGTVRDIDLSGLPARLCRPGPRRSSAGRVRADRTPPGRRRPVGPCLACRVGADPRPRRESHPCGNERRPRARRDRHGLVGGRLPRRARRHGHRELRLGSGGFRGGVGRHRRGLPLGASGDRHGARLRHARAHRPRRHPRLGRAGACVGDEHDRSAGAGAAPLTPVRELRRRRRGVSPDRTVGRVAGGPRRAGRPRAR